MTDNERCEETHPIYKDKVCRLKRGHNGYHEVTAWDYDQSCLKWGFPPEEEYSYGLRRKREK